MGENRFYNFRIITYNEEKYIKDFCNKYCSKWEYILHDKDITKEGEKKEPHWHINCTVKVWRSIKGICKLIEGGGNTLAIPMRDKEEAHRYLMHLDDETKFQYAEDDIKTNIKWKENRDENRYETEEFINDLMDESMTEREKAIKYGRDYIKNYGKYNEFKKVLMREKIRDEVSNEIKALIKNMKREEKIKLLRRMWIQEQYAEELTEDEMTNAERQIKINKKLIESGGEREK